MPIRAFDGFEPSIAVGSYVDESAVLIGQVSVGERSGIFPGAVLRADESAIEIGRGSFVLDSAIIEAPSGYPVTVGNRSIVSHGATLHGCKVGDDCLVGIGAIVLEGASIGDRCIVAAGSLVPARANILANSVVMGIPAKSMREINEDDAKKLSSEVLHLRGKIEKYRCNFQKNK